MKRLENRYNLLVQLDYLTALLTASLLPSNWVMQDWLKFTVSLVASLILGWVTVRTYAKWQRDVLGYDNKHR
jgi:hypothetical protein